ncbi:hypothetical protein, partial [Yersinia pestis]
WAQKNGAQGRRFAAGHDGLLAFPISYRSGLLSYPFTTPYSLSLPLRPATVAHVMLSPDHPALHFAPQPDRHEPESPYA